MSTKKIIYLFFSLVLWILSAAIIYLVIFSIITALFAVDFKKYSLGISWAAWQNLNYAVIFLLLGSAMAGGWHFGQWGWQFEKINNKPRLFSRRLSKTVLLLLTSLILAVALFLYFGKGINYHFLKQYLRATYRSISGENSLGLVAVTSGIEVPKEEAGVWHFIGRFLSDYADVYDKKNYDELRSYFSSNFLEFLTAEKKSFSNSVIDFDKFKIINIWESGGGDYQYEAIVELRRNGELIPNEDKNGRRKIFIIKKGGQWKIGGGDFIK